ncbi:MAG: phage tail tape measure protein [Proteobacteria bacterium]|nr:phage tail tape measure protein [Pseudomonadota bacterium]
MASSNLGQLTLDLVAKIAGFTGPLSQAERQMKQRTDAMNKMAYDFGQSIGRSIKSAALEFVAFAGVTVGVGAALESVHAAIDRADKLNDFTQRLGVSAEQMSGWGYAAKQTGTDIDALGVGFKKLQAAMTDGLDAKSEKGRLFAALGVSVTDASGKMKKLEQIVPEIADKFKGLTDDALKTKVAMDLFGKSGTDLMEFLSSGSGGLKDMTDRAKELGIVIDQETASAADNFNDKLTDLHAITQGWAQIAAADLLPLLNSFADLMLDGAKKTDGLKDATSGAIQVFTYLVDIISAVANVAKLAGITIAAMGVGIDRAAEAVDRLKNADFAGALAAYKGVIDNAKQYKKEADDLLNAPLAGEKMRANMASQAAAKAAKRASIDPMFRDSVTSGTGLAPGDHYGISAAEKAAQDKLKRFYGGQDKPAKSARGRTDNSAQRISDELARMQDVQEKWADQLVKKTNPIAAEYSDRLREIGDMAARATKIGVPKDQIDKFTESMKKLAGEIQADELKKFQQEFNDQTAEMAAQLGGPATEATYRYNTAIRDLDEQLRLHLITQDMYDKRKAQEVGRRDFGATSMIQDLNDQIKLLGMSNEQQEIYNNLKRSGAQANSEYEQSIISLTKQSQQMQQLRGLVDDMGNSFGNFVYEVGTGAKSTKDAFKEMLESMAQSLMRFVAQQAAQKFSQMMMNWATSWGNGASMGSSTDAGWGNTGTTWISSLMQSWGSGRASGGAVDANTLYRVNERGPELLSVSGKDYLMMGSSGGHVTPNNRLGGGGSGFTQVINNNYSAPTDPRTQQQIANKAGYEARRALTRNG